MKKQRTIISRDSNFILFIVAFIVIILSLSVTGFLYLQSTVRDLSPLINESGKIRGGTQRIAKLILMNKDAADEIAKTEEGLALVKDYMEKKDTIFTDEDRKALEELTVLWEEVKGCFHDMNRERFFETSEHLWRQANLVVATVELKALRYLMMQYLVSFLVFISILILLLVIVLFKKVIQGRLEKKAAHDSLTNLLNRNYIIPLFQQKLRETRSGAGRLAVLLCDIDHFKKINDSLGHDAGDEVLKGIAQQLSDSTRKNDSLFRYGGEEFLIMTTFEDVQSLMQYAERIRAAVEKQPISGSSVTVSIGVSSLNRKETIEELIWSADSALYKAKENGRNRVEIYSTDLTTS